MATYNYYLRDLKSKKTTPIVLWISANNIVTKVRTGESIEPRYWDKKKQQAKVSYTGSPELNEFLDTYKAKAQSSYRTFKTGFVQPTTEQLRKSIVLPEAKSNLEFKHALEEFIRVIKETHQPSTIRKYNTLSTHLTNFQEAKNKLLTFDNINLEFYESFVSFLVTDKKEKNNNTVCKYIKALKAFMQWSVNREMHKNLAFKQFKAKEYTVDVIYLTEKELFKIYELDLTNNQSLERVRDAFCFGCFTGQRFSDIDNLKWDDIKKDTWYLHTQKTKDIIEIPLNKFALQILKKNYGKPKPLQTISNQKMNDYLELIAGKAELYDKHKLVNYKGNTRSETTQSKHTLITTHTARRTFVTLSLEKGMRPETVMEITGHKDYKTLKRYIKITSKVKAVEMKKIWNKKAA